MGAASAAWAGSTLRAPHESAGTVLASPVVQVERVDFIAIPTRDTDRAMAWYRDALGLPDSDVTEGELETPNVTLSFWEPEKENLPFEPNTAGFGIRVPDVSLARTELEAKGVQFIAETWDSGVCHFAAFRDLDGNTVILHRRYAPRTPRDSR
jgi:catechol 2,3-dioxygenase-like lactoylglutathione lyase family enzyme